MSATDDQRPVFVYGTLRPGQPNWARLLAGPAERRRSGRLPGVDLLDCGHYPAAIERPDASGATGDVVWIRAADWPAALADLDHLEGYHPADPNRLYDRVVRTVESASGPVDCWVYLAGRRLAQTGLPLVPGGDWAAHCADRVEYRRHWAGIANSGGGA